MRWPYVDAEGETRAITTHPNFDVVRNLARSAVCPTVAPEWWLPWFESDDLRPFVLGVEATVGVRPSRFHILTGWPDGDGVLGPGNVRWVLASSRLARARAVLGESEVERWLAAERDALRQRLWPGGVVWAEPRDCICQHDCAEARNCPEYDEMAEGFAAASRLLHATAMERYFEAGG